MFARIFMFVLFRLYMYDMDNVYVCFVLTKWSNKKKFIQKKIQIHSNNVYKSLPNSGSVKDNMSDKKWHLLGRGGGICFLVGYE